jgi:4-amino-4-deoxy-L-arabinose transferase-like glycosyltransferase
MKIIQFIKENKWLVLILALASFLRFYKLDFQSIWLDEILTMNDANPKLTFKEFYDGIMFWEFIPHLYFALVKILFQIFGYTTVVARVFSAIIGIFGVYSMYLFAKEIFNKNLGLLAASILSVNIFHISFSQEIRPYGMLFLFTVLAFYRLIIFIKNASLKNAIYYGLFAGLILNSHFFGFITLFAQYLLLLFFLIQSPAETRKRFFINSFAAGIVTLIIFLPAFEAFVRVSEIQSFWLQKPGQDAITKLFYEFFGNSELVLFIVQFLVLFYVLTIFKEKEQKLDFHNLTSNKFIFSFIILVSWLGISIIIPLLRSHLDVPMILSRYFINILPAIILTIAIGLYLIKNCFIKKIVLVFLILFSLIDLFAITKYYHTVRKTQFRELTKEIAIKNADNVKIVAYYRWLFPYFFQNKPKIKIEEMSFEDYVNGLKNDLIEKKSFWYADANSRPFSLNDEQQKYLKDNFNLVEKLEYYDAWANYYEPKGAVTYKIGEHLDLSMFKPVSFDGNGNMMVFENSKIRSSLIFLNKGRYNLVINGNSLPEVPINGENAHLKVKVNGKEIGSFYLSENKSQSKNELKFECQADERVRIQFIYDNDIAKNNQDRNIIIYSIEIVKK